jgi:membrane protease YdiL (CAAX protease family)
MDANLAGRGLGQPPPPPPPLSPADSSGSRFPYANWGPGWAIGGVLIALGAGIAFSIPAAIAGHKANGDLTTFGNVGVQLATALGFLLVPMAIAGWRGASSTGEILSRLGVRRFRPSAIGWMALAIVAYLTFAALYSVLILEPHQEDIAEGFGAIPVQILLIAIAAPVSEEVCFRGMLFGGLRQRLPRLAAALIAALIFGALHAVTGISAVPPLIFFGFVLCLLYEKTGSIVPGIILHVLNNSVALLGQ